MSQYRQSQGLWAIVRWLLVIPAAVLGYMLAYTVFFYVVRWNLSLVMESPDRWLPLFAGAAGGAMFVLVGSSVAPTLRGITALVLLIANVAIVSISFALHLVGVVQDQGPVASGLELAGNLFGTGAALFIVVNTFGWRGSGPVSNLWRDAPVENV